MARARFARTSEQVRTVRAMASYGIPQAEIAACIGCDAKTLRKHFKGELATAATTANAQVAQGLFRAATGWMATVEGRKAGGPTKEAVAAMIFWLKARAGWSERVAVSGHLHTTNKTQVEGTVTHELAAADREALAALAELERLLPRSGDAPDRVATDGAP